MNMPVKVINNEKGFVLITSLLILVVVMIIGIAATNTSILEIQISGNDRLTKESFYSAEGGLHVGAELIEQSIWGIEDGSFTPIDNGAKQQIGNLYILNEVDTETGTITSKHTTLHLSSYVEPGNINLNQPDIIFSYDGAETTLNTIPRTELWVPSQGILTPGNALQQLAGYEGAGKGAASGGGARRYDIHSVTRGRNNSQSHLMIEWVHY